MNIFLIEWLIQLGIAIGCFCTIFAAPPMWPFFTFVGCCWIYMSCKKLRKGIRCVRQCNARNKKLNNNE